MTRYYPFVVRNDGRVEMVCAPDGLLSCAEALSRAERRTQALVNAGVTAMSAFILTVEAEVSVWSTSASITAFGTPQAPLSWISAEEKKEAAKILEEDADEHEPPSSVPRKKP